MAFIDCTQQFSVGSPTLDQQHKVLIAIMNKLHAAMLRGGLKEDRQRIFAELLSYTQSHFNAEEGIMRQASYPRLPSHRHQHLVFVQKARDLHSQLLSGKFTVSIELLRFLKSWLSEHILGSDQQYVPFLTTKKSPVAKRV